jgi:prepilin-type N-terminal cleavage/methylation domain-containing protein
MRRAFTLFELIVVLAILVTVAALSYPTIESMHAHYRVQAAADMLRSAWSDARTRAMEEGQAYRFAVVYEKGNFRVAPDGAEFWGSDVPAGDSANPPLLLASALPKGVRFRKEGAARVDSDAETALPADSVDLAQYSPLAVFLPDGTAREDVAVLVEMSGARPRLVKLRAMTGGVSVRPVDGGAKR